MTSGDNGADRIYRRMAGVRGIPPEHSVVLCGVDRDGQMTTASGLDFADAKRNVDLKLDGLLDEGEPRLEAQIEWPGGPVLVNQLDAMDLASAAGISEDLARAVVEHRAANGPFECGPDIGCVPHKDRAGLMLLAARADYRQGPFIPLTEAAFSGPGDPLQDR